MALRAVWDRIGPLDEDIFAFGEDIDWCVRAKKSGFQVWYCPNSTIVHLKGKGGVHAQPYKKVRGMHDGMWVFYQKHLRTQYSDVTHVAVKGGIKISFALSCLAVWLRNAARAWHQLPQTKS